MMVKNLQLFGKEVLYTSFRGEIFISPFCDEQLVVRFLYESRHFAFDFRQEDNNIKQNNNGILVSSLSG
jgi:hypothetical protein